MRFVGCFLACTLWLASSAPAIGQSTGASARIETSPLRLIDPDPYQVSAVLEPIRRVRLVAPVDGPVRGVDARLGASVREGEVLVQFDPAEANARLRIATAGLSEKQAELAGQIPMESVPLRRAQSEAAQARVELAKAGVDRCSVRAPFAGRVVEVAVHPGQFVLKGTPIVELIDTSSLRAVLPVDRRNVSVGSSITVPVEEQDVAGKVLAVLPLPDAYAVLRELATPFAAASVVLPNPRGQLDAGLRARPAGLPNTPIANIAKRAVKPDDLRGPASSMVQVIRNEYVTNLPVQVLGTLGPERVQVSGAFRPGDALIVGSSVALVPGTLVRFHDGSAGRGIEGTSPNPAHGGQDAGITPPGGVTPGRTGGYTPAGGRRGGTGTTRPSYPPAQTQGTGSTPF